ncbi:MAG: class I SAM-dependent methyltransferase [Bacteroidia bacterium]|jgi:SAM-dependent methyltransferase|nr:class I SAM-dependent methyltransferase [Bacteroidia bacterium]
MSNTTERFSGRVANYVKWRPGYPQALYEALLKNNTLATTDVIADIGAGTGISAALFAQNGHHVIAVEPNEPMRMAGIEFTATLPLVSWHPGTAHQTGLDTQSINAVVAAQAWHWFDTPETAAEFRRILKPGGQTLLIWNDRITHGDGFSEVYEDALRYFAIDYAKVDHKQFGEASFNKLWGEGRWRETTTENVQLLTFEGLIGRVLSSSYMPDETHPEFEFMRSVLKKIFLRYQENGTIAMRYHCRAFHGILN